MNSATLLTEAYFRSGLASRPGRFYYTLLLIYLLPGCELMLSHEIVTKWLSKVYFKTFNLSQESSTLFEVNK